jgi:hypothetical protein
MAKQGVFFYSDDHTSLLSVISNGEAGEILPLAALLHPDNFPGLIFR